MKLRKTLVNSDNLSKEGAMSDNMSNLMNQISNMLNNNEIPDEIKNMMSNLSQNQKGSNTSSSHSNTASPNANSTSEQVPDIDIETIMKIKKVMDSMKETRNDPRANLLRSLKPYLKSSRQEKVEQYIQFLGIEKAFEAFGSLGGDKRK